LRSRCSSSSRSGVFRSAVAALLSLLVTGLELSLAIDSFATSDSIFIKELGIGTALAVLIDATIVRAFLVPSLMALLGHRYWWAHGGCDESTIASV